jgi:hypothetical protein
LQIRIRFSVTNFREFDEGLAAYISQLEFRQLFSNMEGYSHETKIILGKIVNSAHNTPKKAIFALAAAFASRASESSPGTVSARNMGATHGRDITGAGAISHDELAISRKGIFVNSDACEEYSDVEKQANRELAQRITLLKLREFMCLMCSRRRSTLCFILSSMPLIFWCLEC